jgi:hypothetical protein
MGSPSGPVTGIGPPDVALLEFALLDPDGDAATGKDVGGILEFIAPMLFP